MGKLIDALTMNENARIWVSQPDVCRCCLSASGTWDLTACYTNKEVFGDMIQQCLGLTLSGLTEWKASRLICQLCVEHLRSACSFRQQLLEAERCFVEYRLQEKCHGLDERNNKHKLNRKRKKIRRVEIRMGQKVEDEIEIDSDAPIAELNTETSTDEDLIKKQRHIAADVSVKHCLNNKIENAERLSTASNTGKKQISERRRIKQTCEGVLKYTTACPFRHHKSWFQCFYCLEDHMEIQPLRKHTFQSHRDVENELKTLKRYPRSLQIDISELKCIECSLSLLNVEFMKTHLQDKHGIVVFKECIADYKVDKSPYVCHICEIEFHMFRSLTMHLNDHYANCICDVCGKSFINSKRLKVHKRTHDNGSFPCKQCGKVLKTKSSKANHMERHFKRVLKCQICFKPMKHYNDRIKHMSAAHGLTHKFKCPICPKEYNIKHYLATHLRQTHGNKNKKCTECNMAFITNHGLKKHMVKHTGEKAYECLVCRKSYARSYTLKEHMKSHDTDGKCRPNNNIMKY